VYTLRSYYTELLKVRSSAEVQRQTVPRGRSALVRLPGQLLALLVGSLAQFPDIIQPLLPRSTSRSGTFHRSSLPPSITIKASTTPHHVSEIHQRHVRLFGHLLPIHTQDNLRAMFFTHHFSTKPHLRSILFEGSITPLDIYRYSAHDVTPSSDVIHQARLWLPSLRGW